MRNGKLLTEDNPQKLLIDHNALSLNDIVLKLCKNDTFQESYVRQDRVTPDSGQLNNINRYTCVINSCFYLIV